MKAHIKAKCAAAIAAMPPDRPSILSSRLKALVMPIIHTSVTNVLRIGCGNTEIVTPVVINSPAAASCPRSLKIAFKREAVVPEAQERHQRRANEDAGELADVVEFAHQQRHDQRAQEDGDAAQSWRRDGVHAATGFWHIDGVDPQTRASAPKASRRRPGSKRRRRRRYTYSFWL